MADRWAERREHVRAMSRWHGVPYLLRLKAANGADRISFVIGLPDDPVRFVYEQVARMSGPAYTLVMPRGDWYEMATLRPCDSATAAVGADATVEEFFDRLREHRSLRLDGLEARWFDAPEREPA